MGLNDYYERMAAGDPIGAFDTLFQARTRIVAHPLQPLDQEALRLEFGSIKVERSDFVKADEIWIVRPGLPGERRIL